MNPKQSDRRRFLKGSAVLAGLAVGAIPSASGQTAGSGPAESQPKKDSNLYGERSRFVTSERLVEHTGGPRKMPFTELLTPLQDSVGIITPAGLHFKNDHTHVQPQLDPRQHRLLIHGMVDRPLVFTVEDLQRMPPVSRIHFLECNSNSRPRRGPEGESIQAVHGKTSCSEWTGVMLSALLQQAGVKRGASWLLLEAADPGKYTKSIPLEKGIEDAMVCYGQNGEPVRPEQGFPLRMLIPGWDGIGNVKWLRRVKVVDQPYMGKWESASNANMRPTGKSRWFLFEMGPKSVITRPSAGQQIAGRGYYEITGLAWSGGGVVRRVEVSTDGGRSWKDAQLQAPVLSKAHTRFLFPWTWDGAETVLLSRCTDEQGEVQPTLVELAKIWGVSPDYFGTATTGQDHVNAIQSWKIARDGSVHNAMFL